LKFKRQYDMFALKLGGREHSGFPMLERTSRFVLEVLPYVLSALIAAVVVPGFLFYSQAPSTKAAATPNVDRRGENVLGIIREDHAAFAPELVMRSNSSILAAGEKAGISLR
jgi:hypothetical protein